MTSSPPTDPIKQLGCSLLNEHHTLVAEILSYVITSTRDIARLRNISKIWNEKILPYAIKSSAAMTNCSLSNQSFVKEIVNFGECSYAGRYYSLFGENPGFEFLETANEGSAVVTGILLVSDNDNDNEVKIEKEAGYKVETDDSNEFSRFCETMFACLRQPSNSWEEFQKVAKQGRSNGMFLSVEDLEHAKEQGATFNSERSRWDAYLPVLLQVDLPLEGAKLLENASYGRKVLLNAKVPKNQKSVGMFPFLKFLEKAGEISDDDDHVMSTFVGYNVQNIDDERITCQVPMKLSLREGIDELLWQVDLADAYIPLESLWRKYQERNIKEGVAIADRMVPLELHNDLQKQIDVFSTQHQIVDYHPHSNDVVRDIVHPALYSYVKDVSPLVRLTTEVPPVVFSVANSQEESIPMDYWGRPYEASTKYQWLPTYFDVGMDGSCAICDYINNLVPRSEHEDLYTSLAQLFSHALPLLESVYSYGRVVKEHHLRDNDEEMYWGDKAPNMIKEAPISLRGQRLQVVTKIVDYELAPEETYEGVWHVEGMSHEEIVATAIYFIDRDEDITGGNILFKRAFHRQEANYIFSRIDQMRPREIERLIEEGLTPLGRVETIQGRLLAFPNSHVHKVEKLENTRMYDGSTPSKQKRRIIVFFLINPEKRIVSTREVPAQQEHVGGSMKRSDALQHRLELMKERKYTKQDWNVREIELCEH